MSKVLYILVPYTNVVNGPHAHHTHIVVQENIVVFSYIMPNQYKNSRIEDLVNYIKSCPLYYAFRDYSEPFYLKKVYNYSKPPDKEKCRSLRPILRGDWQVPWKGLLKP
ncbi:unnamed protein product [Lactuca saligna]|uniref:Uncharacterized protein n=1 Tax=Lactuca saligna TaxID=75948 RepID=A0AA36A2A6_LACSI|nr:unnamed protein product [Lactuca saligna]